MRDLRPGNDLVVDTGKGPVAGFSENGIGKWFGIPYARSPIGNQRFRRAQEAEPWSGVLSCKTIIGAAPIQYNGSLADNPSETGAGERRLSLPQRMGSRGRGELPRVRLPVRWYVLHGRRIHA